MPTSIKVLLAIVGGLLVLALVRSLWPYLLLAALALGGVALWRPGLVAPLVATAPVTRLPAWWRTTPRRLAGMTAGALGALALLGAGLGATIATPAPTVAPVTATPPPVVLAGLQTHVAEATPYPTATSIPAPTATARPTLAPTAVPPSPAPQPPTATPVPPLVVEFTGRFRPTLLRVGQKLVVELTLENKGERPIEGFSVFSTGPWDKYTIVNVMPGGQYEGGFLGWIFRTAMVVPPGEKRTLNIVAYPNEPGNHEFSFIPHEGEIKRLRDAENESIVIGGTVNVIR